MDQALAAPDLAVLNKKLDLLTTKVQFLAEEAELISRIRESRAELANDVLPIMNDVYRMTTEQLEEIQDYVDLDDLLRLVKRVMRNGRNLEAMFDRLESLMDLAQTVGPLTDSAFQKVTDLLQTAEEKDYFAFAKDAAQLVASVVASLDEPVKISTRGLLHELRDPDVRRGLALTLRVLGVIGAQAGTMRHPSWAEPSVSPETPAHPASPNT
jgi:uncharacterized protein YjgD (DUF1641 family)